jgi:photosystem II stability/assembly factor-like uncharacterized protein/diadenosine tetraphosphatase ApaH/serine/threonine PP2A family protein phosphatase
MIWRRLLTVAMLGVMLFTQSVPRAVAASYCNAAQYVSDLTIPDGAFVAPGEAFTKTWRFRNVGTCTWTTAYTLRFQSGSQMSAPVSVNLPVDVPPGQMVDVSVNMVAPAVNGHYRGYWKFANASGTSFGIGSSASSAFWVDINVVENSEVAFDFVAYAPYAQWKSGAGPLPFPGTSGDSRGYAQEVDNPHLESDAFDTLPGLLTVPQNKYNGYLQATYPEYLVQKGDHLQTLVNCEFGATNCYVTFRIDYMNSNGWVRTLWSWKEMNDGRFYRADIDLSSLAGQKYRFIFMMLSTGYASGDRALWGSPRIVHTGSAASPVPPTPTPLPPLTPTPTPFDTPIPTIPAAGCDRASFVSDVTVRDGTQFAPGAAFTKTWRLKNSGWCPWTTSYSLQFYNGEQMGAQTTINMPWTVWPGQSVNLTVDMVAPTTGGEHRGEWVLRNTSGKLFGIGQNAASPFWVMINVAGWPFSDTGYDFIANACAAQWYSSAGLQPCPGTDGDPNGFVLKLDAPKLEDGSTSSVPALLTMPQYKYNGYLMGTFPTFTVQPGDRFQATVGCEYGSSCYVTYRLDYKTPSGWTRTFWTWREMNEGRSHNVDVDLSPLAGQSVRFVLTMLSTGYAKGDRALWTGPRIYRVGGGPPTATPTPALSPGTVIPTPNIDKLFMLDTSTGWAIGDPYLLRTTDGGLTWYDVSMVGGGPSITNGYFPTADKGWVIADLPGTDVGSLFRTVDGGHSWTRFDVPFLEGYIQFLDDMNGFVLSGQPSGMNKQAVTLYQTSDGGATWTRKFTNNPLDPSASDDIPFGGHKNGMAFHDTLHGWVGGDYPSDGFIYLYATADGGVTWTQQSLDLPAGYESAYINIQAPIFFPGSNSAVLPVSMGLSGGKDLFIYVSQDGGMTWTRSAGFAHQGELYYTDFYGAATGFTWDWAGLFHVTHNRGDTWNDVTPNVALGDDLRGIDFVTPFVGWAFQIHGYNSTSLYKTTDGGYTWTLLYDNTTAPTATPTNTPTITPSPTPITSDWLTYTNATYGFEFKYPPQAQITGQSTTSLLMTLPIVPGTNLVEKYLDLRVQEGVTTCYHPIVGPPSNPETVVFNGVTFTKGTGTDQGAGQIRTWADYSTVKDNNCISLLFVLHASNPDNYYPTPIPLYDQAAESAVFAQMMNTFQLLAPTPTPTPVSLIGPYAVVRVAVGDVLNIRSAAGASNPVVGSFSYNATGVMRTGPTQLAEGHIWAEVQNPGGGTGWVNTYYLTEYVTHADFCADSRILPKIDQLRQAMNLSDGSQFAALVNALHGVDVRLWAYQAPVNFTPATAANVFTSTQTYNWGSGPSGNPDVGTFADIIQPKLLDVLNASNMETYCDDLTKVYPLSNPWPYPNIRYYNLYKPATAGTEFDYRTWLVGFEYIDNQPYLYAMVTIVWEP